MEAQSRRLSICHIHRKATLGKQGSPAEAVADSGRAQDSTLRLPRIPALHASLLIDVGANPKVAQQQLRHSDVRITLEAYVHVIGDAQRQAVDKVGEMLRPNAKFCAQVRPN
jgi:integrase